MNALIQLRRPLLGVALVCGGMVSMASPARAQPSICASASAPAEDALCAQAIAGEADALRRAQILFERAFAHNEHQRYDEALADLNQVLALNPQSAAALHERAYTFNELGRYREAEADLDAQARSTPNEPTVYQERAFARFFQGNLTGAYADRDAVVRLTPNDAGALLARADVAGWLGRFDDADRDIAAALAVPGADRAAAQEAARVLTLLRTATPNGDAATLCTFERLASEGGPPRHIIGDCTRLFLQAQTNAARAEALTTRSVAWRLVEQRESAGVSDLRIAAAIDPDNWQWHANLGQAYLAVNHSWAARIEFDRSLALEENWVSYAGRSSANLNLGDVDAALSDANASMRLQPNLQGLIVLGDIALDHQNRPEDARRYWLSAYDMGSRDDRLIERLRRVGVTDPASERR